MCSRPARSLTLKLFIPLPGCYFTPPAGPYSSTHFPCYPFCRLACDCCCTLNQRPAGTGLQLAGPGRRCWRSNGEPDFLFHGEEKITCLLFFLMHVKAPTSSPLVAELAGKAVQMVNIISGPHHHLKGRDQLTAGSAIPSGPKEPAKEAQSLETALIKWRKD